MKRRAFLATIPAAIVAGCVGSGEESEAESTQADDGFEPDGVVLDWGDEILSDRNVRISALTLGREDSIEYYSSDSDSVEEYDPENASFLSVGFSLHNNGGITVDVPSLDDFSLESRDNSVAPLREPPENISWEELRSSPIQEYNPMQEDLSPGSSVGIDVPFKMPEGMSHVKSDLDYEIDGEKQSVFWEL